MAILRWSQERGLAWHYIAPGKPQQNAFSERFNSRLRDLIDRIDLVPAENGGEPEMILTGALASMVRLGLGDKRAFSAPPSVSSLSGADLFTCSVKLVAGACNHLYRTKMAYKPKTIGT
jgi:transposase InsO family protein